MEAHNAKEAFEEKVKGRGRGEGRPFRPGSTKSLIAGLAWCQPWCQRLQGRTLVAAMRSRQDRRGRERGAILILMLHAGDRRWRFLRFVERASIVVAQETEHPMRSSDGVS